MLQKSYKTAANNNQAKLTTHSPDKTMPSVHILPWYVTNFSVKEPNSNTSEK